METLEDISTQSEPAPTQLDYPLGSEFQLLSQLGAGTYGTVIEAVHIASGKKCAIKKIFNAFANKQQAKRVLREVAILK